MKHNWKVGDKFTLTSGVKDSHMEYLWNSGKVFEVSEVMKSGVATKDRRYFLYYWIQPLPYTDTPLYKKLEGE